MLYILADYDLTKRIRNEIEPAFWSMSPDSVDIAKLQACHLLNSVIAEVLRLDVALMVNRVSLQMIPFLSKILRLHTQCVLRN